MTHISDFSSWIDSDHIQKKKGEKDLIFFFQFFDSWAHLLSILWDKVKCSFVFKQSDLHWDKSSQYMILTFQTHSFL